MKFISWICSRSTYHSMLNRNQKLKQKNPKHKSLIWLREKLLFTFVRRRQKKEEILDAQRKRNLFDSTSSPHFFIFYFFFWIHLLFELSFLPFLYVQNGMNMITLSHSLARRRKTKTPRVAMKRAYWKWLFFCVVVDWLVRFNALDKVRQPWE